MIGELQFAGVLFPAVMAWAIAAIILRAFLTRVLSAIGFYRLVWHRGLFELALLVILWAAVAAITGARSGFS